MPASDDLAGIHILPQARLKQLIATGRLVSVTTFADHMRPDVHWIEPEEYGRAFEDLIAKGDDMAGVEAAYTEGTGSYPGFINTTLGLDEMVITVRSPGGPRATPQDPLAQQPENHHAQGGMAQLRIPLADWDEFVAQAQRVRVGTAG